MNKPEAPFTFSPEHILTIQKPAPDVYVVPSRTAACGKSFHVDPVAEELRDRAFDNLAKTPGSWVEQTSEVAGSRPSLSIPIPSRGKQTEGQFYRGDLYEFMLNLQVALGTHHHDCKLLSVKPPDTTSRPGFIVGRRFQAWLNDGGLNEVAATRCLKAMETPYPTNHRSPGARLTYDRDRDGQIATERPFAVQARDKSVTLTRSLKILGRTFERERTVKLRVPSLKTTGGAEIRARREDLASVEQVGPKDGLYDLEVHGAPTASAYLSLFFGLGSLAYHALQQPVSEDVFDQVKWKTSRNRFLGAISSLSKRELA